MQHHIGQAAKCARFKEPRVENWHPNKHTPHFVSFSVVAKVSSLLLTAVSEGSLFDCFTSPEMLYLIIAVHQTSGICFMPKRFLRNYKPFAPHQLHFKCILIGWNLEGIHLAVIYIWSTPLAAETDPRSSLITSSKETASIPITPT